MIKAEKIINVIVNILFWSCLVIFIWFFVQIFIATSFKIPSDSMEPELTTGDNVLVCKAVPGARLFNIFASIRGEQADIYRLPGFRKVNYNDIIVFNFPHPNNWGKIEMHIMKYYIKRCVGLPGDTLSISNGIYHIKNHTQPVGNTESQQRIARREQKSFEEGVFYGFPYDTVMKWNIKNFGPLLIPKTGDTIAMNRTNYCLYKKIIEWEQSSPLEYKDSSVYLNDKKLESYSFLKNYYFMSGDNGENSQDSRYWGMLPEEYIVGKACLIWKSIDPHTGKFRWNRFMRNIH